MEAVAAAATAAVAVAAAAVEEEAAAVVATDLTAPVGDNASTANQLTRSASAEGKWRLSETRQAQVGHHFENCFALKKC